jgi:hypothetical protein
MTNELNCQDEQADAPIRKPAKTMKKMIPNVPRSLVAHVFAAALSQRSIDTLKGELAEVLKEGKCPKANTRLGLLYLAITTPYPKSSNFEKVLWAADRCESLWAKSESGWFMKTLLKGLVVNKTPTLSEEKRANALAYMAEVVEYARKKQTRKK